jgi:hypothetical protein
MLLPKALAISKVSVDNEIYFPSWFDGKSSLST